MVSALVRLGRDLGLTVIAEGIESPEQLQALRTLECPHIQGFLTDLPRADPDVSQP